MKLIWIVALGANQVVALGEQFPENPYNPRELENPYNPKQLKNLKDQKPDKSTNR